METSNGVDNTTTPGGQGESLPKIPGVSEPTPQVKAPQEPAFFNVMPQSKNKGTLVEPSMKVEQSIGAPSKGGELFKKYKWYIIVAAAVLIGGPLVYYAISKIGGSSYKPENILVKQSDKGTQPSPEPSPPQPVEGFTTSQEWRDKYFPNCTDVKICGDEADPDRDGLSNIEEFKLGTDPNNADSDQDGLADGDEVNVFSSSPLNNHTAKDSKYSDADYFKGGYDIKTGKLMATDQILSLNANMKKFGLHLPTITTLGEILNSFYKFSNYQIATSTASSTPVTNASSASATGTDPSIADKQDRDAQRSNTIKNLELALVKFHNDNKTYPVTNDFTAMFMALKPYLKVATNPVDPVNKTPYIYSYSSDAQGADFTLAFYSEVAGQPIKKHEADAQKDSNSDQAAIYDDQRKNALENLRTALLLYSQKNVSGTQAYVFPAEDKYKTVLIPDYISEIPKDPKTGNDYEYKVSDTFNTFTLKAVLDAPPSGTSGYLCNQEECRSY